MDADGYICETMDRLAVELGDLLDATVMAIVGPMLYGADLKVRTAVERLPAVHKKDRLAIVLQTEGGVVEIVERMVMTLRHHFREIHFIVPDIAMSAGTIFAMSGDVIWMDYFSCLGPIDPQIEREGKLVPALSYVAQFEALKEKAAAGGLTTPELILLQKLDLADLHSYQEAKNLSIALLEDWLTRYKFKDWQKTETHGLEVTDDMRRERARKIAEQLSDHEYWHSHGRPISMDCLTKRLNLRINDLTQNPDLAKAVRLYFNLVIDYMGKTVNRHVVHTPGVYL